MAEEEQVYIICDEAETLAQKVVKERRKGLEWIADQYDKVMPKILFVKTTFDPPREVQRPGRKVIALVQDYRQSGLSVFARFLLEKFADVDFRYVIWIQPVWDRMLPIHKEQTMHHELLHIHPDMDGKTIPHDVETFYAILTFYPEPLSIIERMLAEQEAKEESEE